MFLSNIKQDIEELKYEVYHNSESSDWDFPLESRVSDIEEKLDALMAYLKLTIDYTESAESELIIRKRTKKDDEHNYSGFIGSWGL